MVVALAPDATQPEQGAAAELAGLAAHICNGPALAITTPAAARGKAQLAVGAGAATAVGIAAADLTFAALGKDGFVASSNRSSSLRETGSYALRQDTKYKVGGPRFLKTCLDYDLDT